MNFLKNPLVRAVLAVAAVVMLLYMPTREFLKITFMLGIPFIFLWGFLVKKRRYSFPWITSLALLLLTAAAYGYLLTQLPERIEVRKIVSEGGALVAEGKYDEAIKEYRRLEKLGQTEKMKQKIAEAEKEKEAALLLDEVRQLVARGDIEKAREILNSIPEDTRAAREAVEMKKLLQEAN